MSKIRLEKLPNWAIVLGSAVLSVFGFVDNEVAASLTIFLLGTIAALMLRSNSRSERDKREQTERLDNLRKIGSAIERELKPATIHWAHLDLEMQQQQVRRAQPALARLADSQVDMLRKCLAEMEGGSLKLESVVPAQEYTRRWQELLDDLLEERGKFSTVSNMVIWSPRYFGNMRNRYSENNQAMINEGRGVIERTFVVPPWEMLDKDRQLLARLVETLGDYRTRTYTPKEGLTNLVWIAPNTESYHQHFKPNDRSWSNNLGLWEFPSGRKLSLLVTYLDDPGDDQYTVQRILFTTEAKSIEETGSILEFHRPTSISWQTYADKLKDKYPHLSLKRLTEVPVRPSGLPGGTPLASAQDGQA